MMHVYLSNPSIHPSFCSYWCLWQGTKRQRGTSIVLFNRINIDWLTEWLAVASLDFCDHQQRLRLFWRALQLVSYLSHEQCTNRQSDTRLRRNNGRVSKSKYLVWLPSLLSRRFISQCCHFSTRHLIICLLCFRLHSVQLLASDVASRSGCLASCLWLLTNSWGRRIGAPASSLLGDFQSKYINCRIYRVLSREFILLDQCYCNAMPKL